MHDVVAVRQVEARLRIGGLRHDLVCAVGLGVVGEDTPLKAGPDQRRIGGQSGREMQDAVARTRHLGAARDARPWRGRLDLRRGLRGRRNLGGQGSLYLLGARRHGPGQAGQTGEEKREW